MKSIIIPAFKRDFIYATMGNSTTLPTTMELQSLVNIAGEYNMSVDELNKMTNIKARFFPKIENEHEYVFVVSSIIDNYDLDVWKKFFEEINDAGGKYFIITACFGYDLQRINKSLIVFL